LEGSVRNATVLWSTRLPLARVLGLRKLKKTGNSTAACTITIRFEAGSWYCVPKAVGVVRHDLVEESIGLAGV
jgi:hypothetical protein